MSAVRGAALTGIGHAVPARVVGNAEIAQRLGVEEAWLERRSGTRERRYLADGERLADLAAEAGRAALARARVDGGAIDMVLIATTSPDELSPHASTWVTGLLGADGASTLDVSAACTGFLTGLSVGASAIEAGRAEKVLVVGADGLSRYLNRDDRDTAMLFGDGAGAVVLEATDAEAADVGPIRLHSDPSGGPLINLPNGGTIWMDGRAVFRRAVELMTDVTHEALEAAGIALGDVDLFVYHQANGRILRAVGHELGLDDARVIDTIPRFGNTSAASLPIALSAADEDGRLAPGATVLLAAFGAGLVWGGGVVRWGVRPRDA
ncbi:MAG TPA: beta-ketoacyl-ACP synthase 3 [Baekduia sp.]|uniref:3-oxoacyl-ACP synthase III family protein n=1 Tax=Baekduia sp. TaxID=2600305 RepID=UPI002D79A06B|nr:beta-ketoacyl-ACP synthase 3 [Baekduia sp.]HET6505495.1 beta-ketoacyl-ACP synthase 3 [Baekduia sp.]